MAAPKCDDIYIKVKWGTLVMSGFQYKQNIENIRFKRSWRSFTFCGVLFTSLDKNRWYQPYWLSATYFYLIEFNYVKMYERFL